MIFNRNKKGQAGRVHRPLSKAAKRVLAGIMVASFSTAIGGYAVGEDGLAKDLVAVGTAEAAEIVLMHDSAATIDEMKADVLDRLAKCENPNQKPIVFDTNGVASVGQYQWQPHSFQHYWEKKTGMKLTEKEAVVYALDDAKARELAEWVIFETDKGPGKDWVNCTKWQSLQTLVDFIKAHDE